VSCLTDWFCYIGTALGRKKAEEFEDISCRTSKVAGFNVAFYGTVRRPTGRTQNVNFGTKMLVSLFQIRRQHIFDPFHECADPARQITPMCYDEGHVERPATKIGYDLHKRSTF